MTMYYRHRQSSIPVVVSALLLSAPLTAALLFLSTRPTHDTPSFIALAVLGLVLAAVILLHYLLCSLTIEIESGELRCFFGPGVWRTRVALAAITRTARVRLPWWYGIGVKYIPGGWVYLVAPGAGIELVTADGRIVRLGTDDPDGLAHALAQSTHRAASQE